MLARIAIVTAPGIGKIAIEELVFKKIPYADAITLPLKTQEVTLFNIKNEHIKNLFSLRTVEDIFIILFEGVDIKKKKDLIRLIQNNLKDNILSKLTYLPAKKKKTTTNFWVFVKQDNDRFVHRGDISDIISNYISKYFKKWIKREPADVELWAFYAKQKVTLGIRLTKISFRQRKYKEIERSGSLRPTLASALILLSNPKPDDYFIDPMCGVGTILIERSFWGPTTFIGGGDIDERAVEIAKDNTKSINTHIMIDCWDSTIFSALKDHHGKVNKIVTNIPFGKKFGEKKELKLLYTKALNCWYKVLSTEGEIFLLTSQNKIIESVLKEIAMNYKKIHSFSVQGIYSTVYKIIK
ncbi:MAG: RNA methyltransferase [Desulfobacteraceae bacterium]|nr:RNA methyltransferase [Desulfobacteraceae bacterium]MBC2755219.1 RNA methyltransferase [Desulfobacteraceae bacterium]